MKKNLIFFLTFLLQVACNKKESNNNKIAIVIPVSIDSFTKLTDGIKEQVGTKYEIKILSAEGEKDKQKAVVDAALLFKPKLIVTVGSQMTETVLSNKKPLPTIIAGSITHPETVETLVKVGLQPKRSKEVAIVTDKPKDDSYELLAKLLTGFNGKFNKIGIIYNQGEVNSVSTSESVIKSCNKHKINVSKASISTNSDLIVATKNLLNKGVEAIIIPHDRIAVGGAAIIVKIASEKNIPVFSLDDGTVETKGVVLSVSVSYKEVGTLIGKVINQILKEGRNASDLQISEIEEAKIFINKKQLEKFQLKIPETYKTKLISL